MNTKRIFQVCVACMAVLATLMLGTSQESSLLPFVALIAAISSLVFTDILGWFSLHPMVAGTFGLIAAIYAFFQTQGTGPAGQFVAVANLLIHLQVILFFQKKSIRIYWQLITLSLLQVVVAAALNLFVFFGPLLFLYTIVAICGMITFFVYRETQPFFQTPSAETSATSHSPIVVSVSRGFGRSDDQMSARRTLIKMVGLRAFALLGVSTLVVSLAVFLLMPRFGDGVWRPGKTNNAATGFSGSVDLDDVGAIYENPSIVMRVSFTDEATDQPYIISNSPYLRGGVSDEYEVMRGKWSRLRTPDEDDLSRLNRPQRIFSAVKQTVSSEVRKGNVAFSLSPVCALEDTSDSILLDLETNETRYYPKGDDDAAAYSLGTLALHNGQQSEYSPLRYPLDPDVERRRQLQVRRSMPEIAEIAAEVVKDVDEQLTLERARVMTSYFTNRKQGFQYSLDTSEQRQRGIDPVVDFVTNHRSGHCQYYASALALMLRSQGIPCRVVVGYMASNYNVVGNYYQVREMDAHAWVEAAIPADQVPEDEILPREGLSGDAWVRLDPTPSGDLVIEQITVNPWKEKVGDTLDYMQLLWSEYVLGLNEKRQRKAIYQPIQDALKHSIQLLFSPETWAARWEALLERFRGERFTRDNIRDSVFVALALALIYFTLRTVWRFCNRLLLRWARPHRSHSPKVEFYVRLEKLLGTYGLHRDAQQTPREFAAVAEAYLERLSADEKLVEIPKNTVDFFYRVRFGGDRLDTTDTQRLESSLARLKAFLATANQVDAIRIAAT